MLQPLETQRKGMERMLTGQQIAEARKKKGLTQTALADIMHVSTEAVSKWEKGEYSPSPDKEERL